MCNKALYDIHIDVHKPKDVEGMVALKHYSLLPGAVQEIKVGKGGANVRISGNGRTESIRAVNAGDILEIDRVRRGKKPVSSAEDHTDPAQPSQAAAPASRSASSGSEDEQSHQDWVDFRNRGGKDELQQLTRKLEREQLEKRQAELREKMKQQEEAEPEPEAEDGWQRLERWK
jgi:hypothetical protein